MSLRVIQAGLGRPCSMPCDPNAVFQPGQIAQLKVIGQDVVMGVSDGTAPIGIIDDIKTVAFTQPVVDEIVDIPVPFAVPDGYGNFVSTALAMKNLKNANIVQTSFAVTNKYSGLQLNPVNGILIAPAGSVLNQKINGSPIPNAIRAIVRYAFYVPNIPGEDSTLGSGKVTFWFTRGVFETDQFEPAPYSVNAVLYSSAAGNLTTIKSTPDQPGIAMCTIPPTAHNQRLQFIWM